MDVKFWVIVFRLCLIGNPSSACSPFDNLSLTENPYRVIQDMNETGSGVYHSPDLFICVCYSNRDPLKHCVKTLYRVQQCNNY